MVQTLLHAKWRAWFAVAAARHYGDAYTMRMIAPYAEHLVVFSRPEHIREIARRRTHPDPGERTDVLSRLLAVGSATVDTALSDAELRDQLMTLRLAGRETTASALSWAMHELAAHPEVQRRARRGGGG